MGNAPQGGGEAAGTGEARKSRSRRERLPLRGVSPRAVFRRL